MTFEWIAVAANFAQNGTRFPDSKDEMFVSVSQSCQRSVRMVRTDACCCGGENDTFSLFCTVTSTNIQLRRFLCVIFIALTHALSLFCDVAASKAEGHQVRPVRKPWQDTRTPIPKWRPLIAAVVGVRGVPPSDCASRH